VSWDSPAWTPEASRRTFQEAGEQKRSRLPWKRSKKQASSNGFSPSPGPQPSFGGPSGAQAVSADPLYQPGGSSLQRPAQAAEQRGQDREIFCPRCGQPSPRGLCEPCEDALTQLRQLTVAFAEGFEEIGT
jgi:hypothetical protein